MKQVLFSNQTRSIIEGLLFITNEPLSIENLVELTAIEEAEVIELLEDIKETFAKDVHGVTVIEAANGYMLATKPIVKPYIEKLYKPQMSHLSSAGLETLAIIAYKQPITRGEIEMLRGVKTDKILQTLLSKELIEEQGRKDSPGRPILYGTTKQFLRYFGLNNVKDLPSPPLLTEEVLALSGEESIVLVEEAAEDPSDFADEK